MHKKSRKIKRCKYIDEFERQCERGEGHDGPHSIWGYDVYEDDMDVKCSNCGKIMKYKDCFDTEYYDERVQFCCDKTIIPITHSTSFRKCL